MIKKYIPIALILFVFFLVLIIPIWFVSQEKFFYYWDYAGYQSVSRYLVENFTNAPLTVLRTIINSLNLEYNYLYTIPLIPFMLIFGTTRMSYIMAISVLYQLPFALVLGFIGTQLIPYQRKTVFWSTAALCLMTPITWVPTLRGYPDVGAALLVTISVSLYISNFQSPFLVTRNRIVDIRGWWQLVVIGCLLAVAVLLRRHYTYGAIAFFIAICFDSFLVQYRLETTSAEDHYKENQTETRNIGRKNLLIDSLLFQVFRVGLIGCSFFITLIILGRPFLADTLKTNYSALYSSYTLPTFQVLLSFLRNYGWITCILIGLGYLLGFATGLLRRRALLFLLLFSNITLVLWLVFAKQIGIHYTLHIAMFVTLGLSAFGWVLLYLYKGPVRAVLLTCFITFITINLVVGLIPVRINSQLSTLRFYLFSSLNAPLTRPDYKEVEHLVSFLRSSASNKSMIYVVDSSGLMNFDLLVKAEEELFENRKLIVGVSPQVDSRDFYPLELLMKAEYVILTSPIQFHLSNPQEQRVVEVVSKIFTERTGIARDFQRLHRQFNLAGGAILSIFHRSHPTSVENAVRTFADMRSFIGRRPGSQPDWMVLKSQSGATIASQPKGVVQMQIHQPPSEEENGLILLYAEELNKPVKIQGNSKSLVQSGQKCLNSLQAEMDVEVYKSSGEILHRKKMNIISPSSNSKVYEDLKTINPSIKHNESNLEEGESFLFQVDFHEPYYLVFIVNRDYQNSECILQIEWSLVN